jgi:hypothetical protein
MSGGAIQFVKGSSGGVITRRATPIMIHAHNALASANPTAAGRATLTTVPSMKAMLDPRMVAARIHGSARGAHGTATAIPKTTPSSHGGLKIFAISQ